MREAILWVHRWLGLTAGIVFGIAAGTGAVLVYQIELDTLLGGPRWGATEGWQPPAAIEAAVRDAHPDAPITAVQWPVAGGENVVRVGIERDGRASNVWVDNGSGRLVEPRPQMRVLLGIRRLHVNLFMGRFGRQIVIWTTWAAMLALVLGVYLWWPGIRTFWTGFRIRSGRGAYILNFDLHQALGILAMPLLLFGSATGVLLSQGRLVDGISEALHGPAPEDGWGELRSPAPAESEPGGLPDLARLAASASAEAPRASLTLLTMPASADGVIEAELAAEDGATIRVALDRYTSEALARRREEFRYGRHTNGQLHTAQIGGRVYEVLYLISCVVGFVLLPTGVVVWWMKRTRKAESAERRAASGQRGAAAAT